MKFMFVLVALFASACGVKGDPVPPATPAEIGRGKPVFKSESDTSPPALQRKYYRDTEPKEDDQSEPETR